MKLIRKTKLYYREGNTDKVYEVDLCRLSQGRWVVNFRHGRRGGYLREGTKTISAVDRQKAEQIFDSVVIAKSNEGYQDADTRPAAPPAPDPVPADATKPATGRGDVETAVTKRFQDAVRKEDDKTLRRTVWRIGELTLKPVVPDILKLIPAADETLNYCVAWALGRCADPQSRSALDRLDAQTGSDAVKRINWEARMAVSDQTQRAELLSATVQNLPSRIQAALAADDANQLAAAAGGTVFQGGPQGMDLIEDLYRVALTTPCAMQFVLSALSEIPFKSGYFKAIRHIYKSAEFRLDADVIALLALRFETESPQFSVSGGSQHAYIPGSWKWVSIKTESAKPDSRLAYSSRTRDYFRKRVWRLLRRMGKVEDPRYVPLATTLLLAYSDDHADTPKSAARTFWQRSASGGWRSVTETPREYGAFAGYVAFNHIIRENSRRYRLAPSGLAWLRVTDGTAPSPGVQPDTDRRAREEAFPALWDRHPEALWQLLTKSRCEPVHDFAAQALADNRDFCEQITIEQIRQLLSQPYAATNGLALHLARLRYDPARPDLALLEALLVSNLEDARAAARQWIEDQPDMILNAAGLMAHILTSVHPDVRQWGHDLTERVPFSAEQIQGLIARVMVALLALDDQAIRHEPVIADAEALFLGRWAEDCRGLAIGVIQDLLDHPLEALQVMAGRLLLQHHTPPENLPPALIRQLIQAESKTLRGIGVQLFAKLPEQWLRRQDKLIFTFCTAEDQSVRQAAMPMVRQLAAADPDFGRRLFERLFPRIFRKTPSPEYRNDLVALLSRDLEAQARALDPGTIWRLLQARAYGARQLGAHLLTGSEPQNFSVRQWARLGSHALLVVRQWGRNTYETHLPVIAANMADGLRIMDSDWDDTRDFAFSYFRERFDTTHWTPDLLVGICDSIREDVQRFGRELITTFFDEAHGQRYLSHLSQHPSTNVQLFASNFLEDYAGSDPARLKQLTPYFVTVLSQVNCGRTAKARIFKLLHTAALASAESAAITAPIIDRISATIAVGDRGRCVRILRDINRTYPQIDTLLETVPVQRRPIRTREADHAV